MWQSVDETDKRISYLHSRSTELLDNFVCFQCVAPAYVAYRDEEARMSHRTYAAGYWKQYIKQMLSNEKACRESAI